IRPLSGTPLTRRHGAVLYLIRPAHDSPYARTAPRAYRAVMNAHAPADALVLNCTLKPSPATSSTDRLAGLVAAALADRGFASETVRVVDHAVLPGVERDMGEGDAWPGILRAVLAA